MFFFEVANVEEGFSRSSGGHKIPIWGRIIHYPIFTEVMVSEPPTALSLNRIIFHLGASVHG